MTCILTVASGPCLYMHCIKDTHTYAMYKYFYKYIYRHLCMKTYHVCTYTRCIHVGEKGVHMKTSNRPFAFVLRYTTILAPAIHMVRQRLTLHTADSATTPQQQEFVTKHLPALKQAAAAFANPTDEVLMHPECTWNAFKAVSRAVAQQLR